MSPVVHVRLAAAVPCPATINDAKRGSPVRDRIIVALDTPSADSALELARKLRGHATHVKVGMTLFYAAGPAIVGSLREMGFEVFVDLKLHDIPHQVAGAVRSLAGLGASMLTLHASGGLDMLEAAAEAVDSLPAEVQRPRLIAVTVLTSLTGTDLVQLGVSRPMPVQVEALGNLARLAQLDGVVCSPLEAEIMRELLGEEALVVTPGVRPTWADAGDQARVATPAEALTAGASHLVIGRPVTGADDPAAAFDRIVSEL